MIVSAVIAQRRDDGASNLHYLDGLELFGEENADDLHPSGDGYVRMGERFYEKVFTGTGAFAVCASAAPAPPSSRTTAGRPVHIKFG